MKKGKTQFDAKLRGYLVGVQIGMQMPGSERANGQSEDTLRKHDRVVREQAAKLKQGCELRQGTQDEDADGIPEADGSVPLGLASRGYVSEGDLGWFSPAWATEAFDDTQGQVNLQTDRVTRLRNRRRGTGKVRIEWTVAGLVRP